MHKRSDRVSGLTQSYIRRMTRECNRVGGINLGQGICDLPTPPEILNAAAEAIQADKSTYSRYDGIEELRARIAEKAAKFNGLTQVDRENGIVATIGSTGAFNCVVQALFNPGDGFMLFEPFYGYHLNTLKVGGLNPKFVPLDPARKWEVTREALEDAWDPSVRGIMVNTPANPSGKVFSRAELEIIADFCKEHDVLAVTDEIYEYIVYDDVEHVNLATLPGMWERTVTMSGFSKTFSITGWRLGYVVGHPDLLEPIGLVNDLFYVCAPTPLQWGLARGMMALSDDYYREMAADYQEKRDHFCAALVDAGLTPHVPDGAYYVLADISRFGFDDDKAAAMHILETVGVASVPGSSFFVSDVGKGLTRFCYAKDWEILEQASEQIRKL